MVRRGTDGTAVLLLQLAACGVLSPLMMAQVSGTSSLNSSAKAELPTFSTAGTAGTAGTGVGRRRRMRYQVFLVLEKNKNEMHLDEFLHKFYL